MKIWLGLKNLSEYKINKLQHGKCFVRYLRTRCFCIRTAILSPVDCLGSIKCFLPGNHFLQGERHLCIPLAWLPLNLCVYKSPLPEASILHTDPLSQACPVPPTGVFAGVFKISNYRGAVVLYCDTSHAGHSKAFQ